MKRLILLLMLLSCPIYSQTYYMNVRIKGGNTTSIPIQDIQKITFTNITAIESQKFSSVIKNFTLLQNYPNPFNPKTTIEYQLPKAGRVEIKVYNLNGQLVKSEGITKQEPGLHIFNWDGKNNLGQIVASGMYIYQVVFENAILSKKMTFIK